MVQSGLIHAGRLHSGRNSPDSGKSQTVATEQLANYPGKWGSIWDDQFAYEFPIAGHLSRRRLFGDYPPKYERLANGKIPSLRHSFLGAIS